MLFQIDLCTVHVIQQKFQHSLLDFMISLIGNAKLSPINLYPSGEKCNPSDDQNPLDGSYDVIGNET